MFASTQNFSRTFAGLAGTLLFAGLCVGAATAPAQAATAAPISYGVNADGVRIAQVGYADINLASKAGKAQLEARLRIAARTVCSNGMQDPVAVAEANRCYHETLRATRGATMAAIASGKLAG